MTECTQREWRFAGPGRREVVAGFDGGTISSNGGALLLGELECRVGIVDGFARCFLDHRDPRFIQHEVRQLVAQRVLALCLGHEDLSDHEALRNDPLLGALSGKSHPDTPLAGKSTLSRLELSTIEAAAASRYKRIALDTAAVDRLLVEVFLKSYATPPEQIVLDLDATDFAIHGRQEGRFFHGYYDHYCYLPLYIFCGEHLLCARLRRSNIDAAAGTLDELVRIVAQIRERWPTTCIVLRADSGFCREEIMAWCEESAQRGLHYVLGLAKNERLVAISQYHLGQAQCAFASSGHSQREYGELEYRTLNTWSRSRRVVLRAEHSRHGDNPRYVVTSLAREQLDAKTLYEELYCARGAMENCIKEQQLDLFADRVSAETMQANQVRLYFASIAYLLLHALRRLGLQGTQLERAQCGTIRLQLLKIGAQIRVSVRKLWVALAESFPLQELFATVIARLRAIPSG